MSSATTAFGPGKVILLGEHGVVYGHPALAGPISRGVLASGTPASACRLALPPKVTPAVGAQLTRAFDRVAKLAGRPKIEVSLETDLPTSMGLGSSGAMAVAVARLLLQARGTVVKQRELEALALEMEKEFHGTPSGVDHTTSARNELVLFQRGRATVLKSSKPLKVLIALAGARGSTKATVAELRARQARWPTRYRRIFNEIGAVVRDGASAVRAGDLEALGDAMNVNQGLLSALRLSSAPIDAMVHRLRAAGALGAKLTGAGGDGGAVIGLFPEPEPTVVRLRKEGITCFTSQLSGPRAL
ncbi:MAG: mevalonate kinase [Myxococcaceae bacterium]